MLILHVESTANLLKNTVLPNKTFLKLRKMNKFFVCLKKRKQISVLRAPHVFSKFKQKFVKDILRYNLKVNCNFKNIVLVHKFLEEDLPLYAKLKKTN